jgi:hypothetical protein
MHHRPSLAACAAMVCLIAISGCGGSATGRFKAGYAAARAPLNQTFVDIASTFAGAKGESIDEISRSLGALADRFGTKLARLEALKPPAGVAVTFRTLARSLQRVEGDLRETAAAAKLQSDVRSASDAEASVTHTLYHK